ncbi:MAG: hypothetical protein PWP45_308 [Tepidanaerobacteraceae bacterium]|nr:hypothetical protein [Tepidanaerobacteraceae bacterium]
MLKGQRAKRLLALLTVFFFIAGSVFTGAANTSKVAYAATIEEFPAVDLNKLTSDVSDKNTKDAVMRLAAFGIVNGMEDGKYHPEEKVTREQFAKLLVTALGMESAAKAGVGHVTFKDVAPNRWSAGYISVAAGQGLIKGYPDGTFRPEKHVTYAEAVTMLVRALGYKDEFLPGKWPGNYLAKAAEAEITKYVKFADASGYATRGDVAILVNNTLDAEVVKVDTYESGNVKYYESEKTLLEDKLDITKYEDVRIIANKRLDDNLDDDEVRVVFLNETDDDKYDEGDKKEFDVVKGYNVEPVIGEEVTIYLNDDDELVYAEREYDDKAMFDFVEGTADNDTKLSLVKFDDDYEFDDDAIVYITDSDGAIKYEGSKNVLDHIKEFVGKPGKYVLKNDKIVFADVIDPTEVDEWMVVTDNEDGVIKGISKTDDEKEIDLRPDETYDGVIILDTEGNVLSVDDIEEGNVVYVAKQEIDGDDYAIVRVVKDNIIKGTLEAVKTNKIRIGDEEIKLTQYSGEIVACYSVDNGDTIEEYDLNDSDVASDMEDADGADVIAYTDAGGRIAYFVTEAKAVSGYRYGIVTKIYEESEKLKIYTLTGNGEGDEIVYPVEETRNLSYGIPLNEYGHKDGSHPTAPIKVGSIVKFKLNKNGEIAEDEIYVMPEDKYWGVEDEDLTEDTIPDATLNSNSNVVASFVVDDDTVIIDAKEYDPDIVFAENTSYNALSEVPKYSDSNETIDVDDDFEVIKWADLAEDDNFSGKFYVFCDDDNNVEAEAIIFIREGTDKAAQDEEAAYIVDKWYKGGDLYVEYITYGGSVEEAKADSKAEDIINKRGKERPYIVKIKADGDLKVVDPKEADDFKIYFGTITTKSGSDVTAVVYQVYQEDDTNLVINYVGEKQFKLENKAVVYEEDEKKSTSNIHAGDCVVFITEKGGVNIKVIERLVDEEADKVRRYEYPYGN